MASETGVETVGQGGGGVRVVTRVRPLLSGEEASRQPPFEMGAVAQTVPSSSSSALPSVQRLGPNEDQNALEKLAEGLASDAAGGFGATLVAFGPPGGGKSHSLFGTQRSIFSSYSESSSAEWGVLPRTARRLFKLLRRLNDDGRGDWQVSMSCAEFQKGCVLDLLSVERDVQRCPRPEFHEHPYCGAVFVPGLTEDVVENVEAFVKRLAIACRARAILAPSPGSGPPAEPRHMVVEVRVLQRRRGPAGEQGEDSLALSAQSDDGPATADGRQRLIRTPGWSKLQALVRDRREAQDVAVAGGSGGLDGRGPAFFRDGSAWTIASRLLALELAGSAASWPAGPGWGLRDLPPAGANSGLEALSMAIARLSCRDLAAGGEGDCCGDETIAARRREATTVVSSVGTQTPMTRLLASALCRGGRLRLLVALSPAASDAVAVEAGLRYATSACSSWNTAQGNMTAEGQYEQLEAEVFRLRRCLESPGSIPPATRRVPSTVELETQLAIAERLLADARKSFAERRRESVAREQLRRRNSLFCEDASIIVGMQASTFLIRICYDAFLSGTVVYEIRYGLPPLIVGSDQGCTIQVGGLGVAPKMCSICMPSQETKVGCDLEIIRIAGKSQCTNICVNGVSVTDSSEPVHVPSGALLELGYSNAFRVQTGSLDIPRGALHESGFETRRLNADDLRAALVTSSAVQMDEKAFEEVVQFTARRLDSRHLLGPFIRRCQEMKKAVAEAEHFLNNLRENLPGEAQIENLPTIGVSVGLTLCPADADSPGIDLAVQLVERLPAGGDDRAVVWWSESKFRRRLSLMREASECVARDGIASWWQQQQRSKHNACADGFTPCLNVLREFDPEERQELEDLQRTHQQQMQGCTIASGSTPDFLESSALRCEANRNVDVDRLLTRLVEQEEDLHLFRERLAAARRGSQGISVVRQVRDMQAEIDTLHDEIKHLQAQLVAADGANIKEPTAPTGVSDPLRSELLNEIQRLRIELAVATEEAYIARVLLSEEQIKRDEDAVHRHDWEVAETKAESEAKELARLLALSQTEARAASERYDTNMEGKLRETESRLLEAEAQLETASVLVEERLDAVEEERLRMQEYSREAVRCLQEELHALRCERESEVVRVGNDELAAVQDELRESLLAESCASESAMALRSELVAEQQRANDSRVQIDQFKKLLETMSDEKASHVSGKERAELAVLEAEARCKAAQVALEQAHASWKMEAEALQKRDAELMRRLDLAEQAIADSQRRVDEAKAREEEVRLRMQNELQAQMEAARAREGELTLKLEAAMVHQSELQTKLEIAFAHESETLAKERGLQATRNALETSLAEAREATKDLERELQARKWQHESDEKHHADALRTREEYWTHIKDATAAELDRERDKFRQQMQHEERLMQEAREAQRRYEKMEEKVEKLQEDVRVRDVQIEGLKREAYRLRKEFSKLLGTCTRERQQLVEGDAFMGACIRDVSEQMASVEAEMNDVQHRLESMSRAASATNSPVPSYDRGSGGHFGTPAKLWPWPRSLSPCPPLPRAQVGGGGAGAFQVGSQVGVVMRGTMTPETPESPMQHVRPSGWRVSRGPSRADGSPRPLHGAHGSGGVGAGGEGGTRQVEPEEEAEVPGGNDPQVAQHGTDELGSSSDCAAEEAVSLVRQEKRKSSRFLEKTLNDALDLIGSTGGHAMDHGNSVSHGSCEGDGDRRLGIDNFDEARDHATAFDVSDHKNISVISCSETNQVGARDTEIVDGFTQGGYGHEDSNSRGNSDGGCDIDPNKYGCDGPPMVVEILDKKSQSQLQPQSSEAVTRDGRATQWLPESAAEQSHSIVYASSADALAQVHVTDLHSHNPGTVMPANNMPQPDTMSALVPQHARRLHYSLSSSDSRSHSCSITNSENVTFHPVV